MSYFQESRQLESEDFVCSKHVENEDLAEIILKYLEEDPAEDLAGEENCSLCNSRGIQVEILVELVSSAVNKLFETANNSGMPRDEGSWAYPVKSTEDVLAELEIYSDCPIESACLGALGDEDWVSDGDGWPNEHSLLQSGWVGFCNHLKHRSRFLFETVASKNQFGVVESLGTRDFLRTLLDAILKRQLTITLLQTDRLYRARAHLGRGEWPTSAKDYSSPSEKEATQGRMNPAGISYFYCSRDMVTAATEVFDGSSFAAVAAFVPVRELTLVDLTNAQIANPFDSEVSLTSYRQSLFLHDFTQEIAAPIIRDGRIHQEYVPTQAVTEYIRFNFPIEIHGIAFSSARASGTNVVLFADQTQCLEPLGDESVLVPTGEVHLVEFGSPNVIEWNSITVS